MIKGTIPIEESDMANSNHVTYSTGIHDSWYCFKAFHTSMLNPWQEFRTCLHYDAMASTPHSDTCTIMVQTQLIVMPFLKITKLL